MRQGEVTRTGVSVCVPVFGSTRSLYELCDRVVSALSDRDVEIVLVDDGSTRQTWGAIEELAERSEIVGIRLGRNAGQHAALLAGIRAAKFDTIVTMDDDLQNPPEEIPSLLAILEQRSDIDVVYGYAARQAQRGWRRAGSQILRRILSRLLRIDGAAHLSPFRAFRTRLRDGFREEVGPGVSIDALLAWSTDAFASVEVEHTERHEGRSGYTFSSLRRFAVDVITGYSTAPLRFVTLLGLLSSVFGLVVLFFVLGRYLTSGVTVAGFPFLASLIALFSGAQMLSLGIIGEYLGRTHVRVMGRPTYVIAESIGRATPGDVS